jgi:hypothetical protein
MIRIFRYVTWEQLDDYLRLGWCPAYDLGPVHRRYSIACEWVCACRPVEPETKKASHGQSNVD